MTQLEAAKMLVVAWVKDWGFGTLAKTIAGEDYTAEGLHKSFPFMTGQDWILRKGFGKGISVRRYVADYLPSVNALLWDAKDNEARIALAGRIQCAKCLAGKVTSKEAAELRKAKKVLSVVEQTNAIAMQVQRRSQRGAWNVCKA